MFQGMNVIDIKSKNTNASSKQLFASSLLCNNANFIYASSSLPFSQQEAKGDATDIALLRFGAENYLDEKSKHTQLSKFKENYIELAEIPFNSKNKWMMKFYLTKDFNFHNEVFSRNLTENTNLMLIKGAPDILLM